MTAAERPLVTIVIPTWNRLPLLRHAVASVAAQTYPAWELVLVDDGSTDGTAEWVRSLGDPRIRVVELPRCAHVGRLRNHGTREGSGELVAFLDSDDEWLPGKLEAQVDAMRAAGVQWCYGRYELMDADGRPAPRRAGEFQALSGSIARELLMDRTDVFIGTLLVERSLFEEAGGFSEDPRVKRREDWELHVRLAMRAAALALDRTLARVRDHDTRTTAVMDDPFTTTVAAYDAFLETNPPAELARLARRGRAVHLADTGAEQLARGAWSTAAGMFARALLGGVAPGRWARAIVRGARARGCAGTAWRVGRRPGRFGASSPPPHRIPRGSMADTPDSASRAAPGRGPFIVLEGIDGAGTTTQLHALRDHFQRTGRKAFFTHEPSDGPVGMLIRLALQGRLAGGRYELHDPGDAAQPASADFDRTALALLFAADRADHVATQVKPNLDAGRIVVCDRYLLSTLAYQGQSCDIDWLLEINRPAVIPDLTLFLDVPPSAAEARMRASRWKKEMFETKDEQGRIRDAYLRYIEMEIPQVGEVRKIDSSRPADEVSAELIGCVEDFLNG